MESLEKYFDSIGEKGSIKRLAVISTSNLGLRSDAASRVCEKRYRRKELMDMGLSYENTKLIVDRETMDNNQHQYCSYCGKSSCNGNCF